MTIYFDENLVGTWYVVIDDETDWLAGLSRTPDGGFDLRYRFRYYTKHPTGDPFLDDDEKHWFGGHISNTDEATLLKTIRAIVQTLPGQQRNEFLRGEQTFEEFMEHTLTMPFMHAKVLKEGDDDGA